MAIACLGFVTFLLLLPMVSLPSFMARISRSTSLPAPGEYLRPVDFFAGAFVAAEFFAPVDLPTDFFAGVCVMAVFLLGADFVAGVFFAVAFFAVVFVAGDFFTEDFFAEDLVEDFFAVAMGDSPIWLWTDEASIVGRDSDARGLRGVVPERYMALCAPRT